MRLIAFSVTALFFLFGIENGSMALNSATYIFMNVARKDNSDSMEICANFYPNSVKMTGALPPARNLREAFPYRSINYDNEEAFCRLLPLNTSLSGKIVHTFLYFNNDYGAINEKCDMKAINDRILRLQDLNAGAALFVTTPDETHASYYDPRVNGSMASIPLYYINEQSENKLQTFFKRGNNSEYVFRFYIPEDSVVDGAMVVVLLISMICISIGGLWSGHKHYELYVSETNKKMASEAPTATGPSESREQNATAGQNEDANPAKAWAESSGSSSNSTEPAAAPFNWITLTLFIVIIVGFLLLLYYLYNVVVWLVIVIYVIASSCAMCECLWFLVEKIPYGRKRFTLEPVADFLTRICRCCKWKMLRVTIDYRHAALYFISLSLAVVWCVYRHWSYSFILHDVLAIFFSIVTIRNLRIPNLKWITMLLSLLLVYDLFMVFITPYMTPSGCSVMIDVATGGACSTAKSAGNIPDPTHNYPPSTAPPKEELPIVIRVPRLNDPLLSCYRMEVDLQYPPVILGLGDIILPGVLIGYNAAFSLASRVPYRLYYVVGVVGYFVGMICTFAALLLSRAAQPALIYLVPFTLIPTHITAAARKEWKKMWTGQFPLVEESCPILKPDGSDQSSATDQRPNSAFVENHTRIHGTDHVAPA